MATLKPDYSRLVHQESDVKPVGGPGEVVRERHYANFADWITRQYEYLGRLGSEKIDLKVAGRVNLSNAGL